MGTTPLYGWRYPEPTDLLTNAHAHIRNAIEDIEDTVTGPLTGASWIASDLGAGPAQTADPAGVNATLGGVTSGPLADWAFNGSDTFTYSGPARWFHITASCAVVGLNDSAEAQTDATLIQNGVVISRSVHRVALDDPSAEPVFPEVEFTHKLDTTALIGTGHTLVMQAAGNGPVTDKVIRVLSIGGV